MNQVFVFQECHGPESFRFEGLELPYLKKWTARHCLCQPLQYPEEQWRQKYVWWRGRWCDSFMCVGRNIWRHAFLSTWPINLVMWSSRSRGCSDSALHRSCPWSLRKADSFFLQNSAPFSRGCSGGRQWCVPLILCKDQCFSSASAPRFSIQEMWDM